MSWDANTAATTRPCGIDAAAWSPCDRFIAITWYDAKVIEVLDSVTLRRLQTLEFPQAQHISVEHMALIFSSDSRILTCFGQSYPPDRKLFVVSWDLQTGGVASVIKLQGPHEDIAGTPSITYSERSSLSTQHQLPSVKPPASVGKSSFGPICHLCFRLR